MRKLEELLIGQERAWVYLGNDEQAELFMKKAREEDWHFSDGSEIGDAAGGYVMALHSDRTVAYLQVWIWMKLFGTEAAPLCVDFKAFAGGKADFIATDRGFTGRLIGIGGEVIAC